MKRISTRIIQLLLLSFILAAAFSASAEEYKSMIRYDRVWEHLYIHWNDRVVYHVKFDGTEEINGKTYHRLAAFRKASYAYNAENQPYLFNIDENYYEHEGYMREEDGKVYTLTVKHETEDGFLHLDLYTPEEYLDLDSFILEEKLIYDFTCGVGETYRGLQIQKGGAEEIDYKVNSIEHVEIDGEEHRLLRVDAHRDWLDDWYEFDEPIVEGIGIAEYGCLTTINFLDRPTCPCIDHVFNRVLSTDGRVLYRAEYGCAEIPVDDFLGTDGIAEISNESEAAAPCYDFLGRRIAQPAPGQLYIQGGRKHIAR